ncbi:MAG: thioredoxin family protein [Chitinophagaceae bacterium]|jgi:thiol:disulfide interchange protein DsbD|nr:thioredoxin family protein [Chitinophagaceae bacterium]
MKHLLSLLLLLSAFAAQAQTKAPVSFSTQFERSSDTSGFLVVKAAMEKGFQLFSVKRRGADDPFISSIRLDSAGSALQQASDTATELGTLLAVPSGSGDHYRAFADSVTFKIPLHLPADFAGNISGSITWLGLIGEEFPNGEESFTVEVPAPGAPASGETESAPATEQPEEEKSLWTIFLEGFLAGLGAFIMPCIYAMVPVTVSFFTKRSKTRKQGITNAAVYAGSIIGIFTLIGFLITILFGKGALNDMASSAWFNVGVFVLFMVFGISFLGAFEITLPASWSNKIDSKSGLNSYSGIFFLALTLVIVSFSCTVPFIGALTVLIAKGSFWAPLVGFFAFSLALALPFAIFTVFPSLLNNMAKSGGWLNTIKVSLGFIELALALKFLSSADLAYHWGLLDREVYLSLWIVIFGLLGLYLLGKLKFHHDDELPKNDYGQPYLSVTRLFFAIAALSFTVYMIPGLWGAPLNGISAWLPEMKTQDFKLNAGTGQAAAYAAPQGPQPKKYTDLLESEIPGVQSFFDYEEALAAARELKKPLMIDFTGHSCANCRKMEREVLSNPEVMQRLQNDFVVVSLYVDDKHPLPESEWKQSKLDGRTLKRMGEMNLDFEVELTNNNAQPYYVFVDNNGKLLVQEGYGYDPDIQKFLQHLDRVKARFAETQ